MPYHIEPHLIIEGTFYTLLIFSVLTWTLILFKLWQFGKNSYYNRRFNKAFWDAPDLATAKNLPKTFTRGPQARIASKGFNWLDESRQSSGKHLKYRGAPDELLAQNFNGSFAARNTDHGIRPDPARQHRQHCAVCRAVRYRVGHHARDA